MSVCSHWKYNLLVLQSVHFHRTFNNFSSLSRFSYEEIEKAIEYIKNVSENDFAWGSLLQKFFLASDMYFERKIMKVVA